MEKKQNIINYEELERGIVAVENLLADYDLEEKRVILRHVLARKTKKDMQRRDKERFNSMLPKFVRDRLNQEDDEI
jgi:hypothetical protein